MQKTGFGRLCTLPMNVQTVGPQYRNSRTTAILAIGYFAIALAILAARNEPAAGYELSIYAATPLLTWIGIGVAAGVALFVTFGSDESRGRPLAIGLAGLFVATIVSLPLIRGYYFHGTGDPLTHLGWTRDIANGLLATTELHYPGIHSFAIFINEMTGMALPRSLLLVTFVMAVAFLVFVPLCVRVIAPRYSAVAIGLFAALLFIPINTISMNLRPHPYTLTALFSAMVLYLLFKYVTTPSDGRLLAVTSVGGLLAIGAASTVLFHPQQALNLLILFAAICAVQASYRLFRNAHTIATHRPMYAQTGLFAIIFGAWVSQIDWIFGSLERHVTDIAGFFLAGGTGGADIAQRGESLAAVAGSGGLYELFFKLFLVASILSIFAAGLMLAELLGRLDATDPDANALVRYLTVALVPLMILFSLYFLGSIEMYWRHHGFIMVLVTIVGAVSLERAARYLSDRLTSRHLKLALVVGFALMLPLSLATVFYSPYIYLADEHVSEANLNGHEVVFEVHGGDVETLAGVRSGPWRYSDAVHGVENSRAYETVIPEHRIYDLPVWFEEDAHVVLTRNDYEREVHAYREFRYSQNGLDSLDRQPNVNRVVSNGEVRLYHVSAV